MTPDGAASIRELVALARGRVVDRYASAAGAFAEPCSACLRDGRDRPATCLLRIESAFGPGSAVRVHLCAEHEQEFARTSRREPGPGFGFGPAT